MDASVANKLFIRITHVVNPHYFYYQLSTNS